MSEEEFQSLMVSDQTTDEVITQLAKKATLMADQAFLQADAEHECRRRISSENTSPHSPAASSSEISDFFRRVNPQDVHEVFSSEWSFNCTPEALVAFQKGDWENPVFSKPNWIRDALMAFRQGLLSKERISVLLLYAECQKTKSTETSFTYQLLDENNNLNEEAFKIIRQATQGYFSEEELKTFVANLKKGPAENTQFFKVPIKGFPRDEGDLHNIVMRLAFGSTITEFFYYLMKFRLCLIKNEDSNVERAVLPPHLFYELLKVKWGQNAMQPNGVLGLSDVADFERTDQRDVLLPTRLWRTPSIADGFAADPLDFYHHDMIYHMYTESGNIHRDAWLELALLFKGKSQKETEAVLADRDIGYVHLPEMVKGTLTDGELFWLALGVLHESGKIKDTQFLSAVIKHINENSEKWENAYHISLNDLRTLLSKKDKMEAKTYANTLSPFERYV